jgi:hypothetical protein
MGTTVFRMRSGSRTAVQETMPSTIGTSCGRGATGMEERLDV